MEASEALFEQRAEARVASRFRLFVHIQRCLKVPSLVGKAIVCEAVDVSQQGIQIVSDVVVPAGTILNVSIAVGQPFAMYLLEGEVRWQQNGEDGYAHTGSRMGILLLDQSETDYQKWVQSYDSTVAWIDYLENLEL